MTEIAMSGADYSPKTKKDILKDTPVRVMGYADDIAAASKPLVEGAKSGLLKTLPGIAYIPATAYMAANVVDKFRKGEDGTGKKPSVKAGIREAVYQGAVNVLAPMAVVKGVSALAKKAPKVLSKLPDGIQAKGKNVLDAVKNNKIGAKVVNHSGMIGKAAVFGLSLVALAKLAKPIDKTVDKVMEKTLDPFLKLNNKTKVEKIETDEKTETVETVDE